MDPKRAARLLALLGAALLITVLVLRGMSLAATTTQMKTNPPADDQPQVFPRLGNYTLSKEGTLVFFEQQSELDGKTSWYSMPVEGGPIRPAEDPQPDMRPFMVQNEQLFLLVGDGYSLTTGSPRESRVASYALSPDGKAMAFAAYGDSGPWGLYILYASQQLIWLGDEEKMADLAWSPDGEYLLYVAPRDGVDQILKIKSTGLDLEQLTFDPTQKRSPRWSPDGQEIAYLAVLQSNEHNSAESAPTPQRPALPKQAAGQMDIYHMKSDGSVPQQLTGDGREKFHLAWSTAHEDAEILYSIPFDGNPETAYLYGVQVQSGSVRQVYPPYFIAVLTCPARLAVGQEGNIEITLANQGKQPADIPLLLRSGSTRFPVTGRRNTGDVQAATAQVPAGGKQTIPLAVNPSPGLFTHVSTLINLGEPFPMDEKNCFIANTFLGLPNLPLLGLVLPVTAAGLALCIPWLRHRRSRWFWGLWAAVPLAVGILTGIETWAAWG